MLNFKKWFGLAFYVSELDQFLINYDKTHKARSFAQLKEIRLYNRIYSKRDHATNRTMKTQSSLIDKLLN